MNTTSSSVDIAIVGAGLVGSPLACALSSQGWSVALLDAKASAEHHEPSTDNRPSEPSLSERCTALSLGTRRWLESQGLWSLITDNACPIEQVHVSHKGRFGATRLRAKELEVDAVGYVVNNEQVVAAFAQHLTHTAVQHITGVRVDDIHIDTNGVSVSAAGTTLKARLLIAADGVSSTVRQSVGINTKQVDYDQFAALSTVQLATDHEHIAYERFTSSGPLALLPRPAKTMSVVDCINPDEHDSVNSLSDDRYLQHLQSRFGYRLGRFKAIGPRTIVPLVRIEADKQIAQRTVLLGNAMRLLHPVGGQGYNLAMRDVAQLCALLMSAKAQSNNELDPGSDELLAQFVDTRLTDQQQVVQFTDTLARGFRGEASLPGHVRALGLISLDTLTPLRKQFARRTMGLG